MIFLLLIGIGFSTILIVRNKLAKKKNGVKIPGSKKSYNKNATKQIKTTPVQQKASKYAQKQGGGFAEKIGELVVLYMIEVSRSKDKTVVDDRITKIVAECERLGRKDLPAENKKIISTVLLWANQFNSERHISEMTLFNNSSQISYNHKKRDFQLTIVEQ